MVYCYFLAFFSDGAGGWFSMAVMVLSHNGSLCGQLVGRRNGNRINSVTTHAR